MKEIEIDVEGMSCSGCEENVSDALTEHDAVGSVVADHESDTVTVTYDDGGIESSELSATIEAAGYEVPG